MGWFVEFGPVDENSYVLPLAIVCIDLILGGDDIMRNINIVITDRYVG